MNSRKFIKTVRIINHIAMIAMIILIISLFGVRDESSQSFLVLNMINMVVDIIVVITAIINLVGSVVHRKFYEKVNILATYSNNDAHTMFPWSTIIVNILFVSNDFTERELKVIEAATRFLEGIYLLQKMDIREVSFNMDGTIPMMIPSQILFVYKDILSRLEEGHYIGENDLNRVTYALIIREMHLLNTYEATTDNPKTNFYGFNKRL